MRRETKNARIASAILTADMHLRADVPECRTDDFLAARGHKVAFLRDLQAQHSCPILDAGDVFNRWQVSSELEGWALLNLPAGIVTVPGNHDLPHHNLSLYKKSSLHVLEAAGKIRVLKADGGNRLHSHDTYLLPLDRGTHVQAVQVLGFPYGEQLVGVDSDSYRKIAIVHVYVAESVPPFIGEARYTPVQLLAALPGYDLIVSGHNHQPFDYAVTDRRGNRRVVCNPGSMMRTTADQADMKPRCYLWYADMNTVEPVYYSIEAGVVSREHIDSVEERDERMEAFVSRLNADVEVGLDFSKNIEQYLDKNKIGQRTRDAVWEAVDAK